MENNTISQEVQADFPDTDKQEDTLKIRPLERIKLQPKVPPEPSSYGKYKGYSRAWILQDGRGIPGQGSEMREKFTPPVKPKYGTGIRRKMLTDFFWEQMLEEVIDDLRTNEGTEEYCTEYDANYVKDNFQPRDLAFTADKDMHLKFPLYGTGSSAITFYSETIQKTGKGEILEKFRRSQDFSKPMEERLDDGWVL